MFKAGQKVRCVDDRFSNPKTMDMFENWVVRDEVYTVRVQRPAGAESGVLLEEIKNPPFFHPAYGGKLEPAFHPRRFVIDEDEMKSEEMVEQAKEILEEEVLKEEVLK